MHIAKHIYRNTGLFLFKIGMSIRLLSSSQTPVLSHAVNYSPVEWVNLSCILILAIVKMTETDYKASVANLSCL